MIIPDYFARWVGKLSRLDATRLARELRAGASTG